MITINVNGQTITIKDKSTESTQSIESMKSLLSDIQKDISNLNIVSNVRAMESFGYKTVEGFGEKLKNVGSNVLAKLKEFFKTIGKWILNFVGFTIGSLIKGIEIIVNLIIKKSKKMQGKKLKGIKVSVHKEILNYIELETSHSAAKNFDTNNNSYLRKTDSSLTGVISVDSVLNVSSEFVRKARDITDDFLDEDEIDFDFLDSTKEKSKDMLESAEDFKNRFSDISEKKIIERSDDDIIDVDAQELYDKIYNNISMLKISNSLSSQYSKYNSVAKELKKLTDKLDALIYKVDAASIVNDKIRDETRLNVDIRLSASETLLNIGKTVSIIQDLIASSRVVLENSKIVLDEIKDSVETIEKVIIDSGVKYYDKNTITTDKTIW